MGMLSKKKMRDILGSVRAIGRNNAGVEEAAQLLAEAMKEGVVAKIDGRWSEEMGYYTLTLEAIQPHQEGKLGFALRSPDAPDDGDGERVIVTVMRVRK